MLAAKRAQTRASNASKVFAVFAVAASRLGLLCFLLPTGNISDGTWGAPNVLNQ